MSDFRRFWDLGYGSRLIPIIPPGADISERSTLYKRIGTKQDGRGKTPGTRGRDGKWSSFDWSSYQADESDLERWTKMGAGVGIKTGGGLIAIDADTLNTQHAVTIRDAIDARLGRLPIRVGRSPKALYVCRIDGPLPYSRIEFGDERVEVLTEGKQFVAEGIHPVTGKPYTWPRAIIGFDALPIKSPAEIIALLDDLRAKLPAASRVITEGAGNDVPQSALKGEIDRVRAAVAATPNTSAEFPSRESYRDMGYAIKAALPDQPEAAYDIFAEWCERWDGGTNEPDVVAADWRRMKPPYRRGASWLYELADQHGKTVWFEPIEDQPENPFDVQAEATKQDAEADVRIKWVRPSEWSGQKPKPREWEVEGWIPRGEVTLLYGDGGIGKTLIAHQYATAAAAGVPWLGQPTRRARIMCFFCEDSEDELLRRQIDINTALGVTFEDTDEHLRIRDQGADAGDPR